MARTMGMDHLGLAVRNLDSAKDFFVKILGWHESGYDPSYPRCSVSDLHCRLTLWQVKDAAQAPKFDRRLFIGLHHLALKVETEEALMETYHRVRSNNCEIEFSPEYLGDGPRKHFICYEPGGLRIEFIWNGDEPSAIASSSKDLA